MFEVGYIEKRNNVKRWIENTADLTAMYHIFQPGSTVTIWCESKDDSTTLLIQLPVLERSVRFPRKRIQ